MLCGEVCTGSEWVRCTELWLWHGILLLPPGLANQRFCRKMNADTYKFVFHLKLAEYCTEKSLTCRPWLPVLGLVSEWRGETPPIDPGLITPIREGGTALGGIWNGRWPLRVTEAPTDPAMGREFDANAQLQRKTVNVNTKYTNTLGDSSSQHKWEHPCLGALAECITLIPMYKRGLRTDAKVKYDFWLARQKSDSWSTVLDTGSL